MPIFRRGHQRVEPPFEVRSPYEREMAERIQTPANERAEHIIRRISVMLSPHDVADAAVDWVLDEEFRDSSGGMKQGISAEHSDRIKVLDAAIRPYATNLGRRVRILVAG